MAERENEPGGPHYGGERGGESAGSEGGQGDAKQPGEAADQDKDESGGVGGRGPTERERRG